MQVENEEQTESVVWGMPQRFWVYASGVYICSSDAPDEEIPSDWINVPVGPNYADQIWDFVNSAWLPYSLMQCTNTENAWREAEIPVIARQLEALEEAEAAAEEGEDPPADLLPGTRNQWLSYRTKVRAWKTGNVNFPDVTKRPVRPS